MSVHDLLIEAKKLMTEHTFLIGRDRPFHFQEVKKELLGYTDEEKFVVGDALLYRIYDEFARCEFTPEQFPDFASWGKRAFDAFPSDYFTDRWGMKISPMSQWWAKNVMKEWQDDPSSWAGGMAETPAGKVDEYMKKLDALAIKMLGEETKMETKKNKYQVIIPVRGYVTITQQGITEEDARDRAWSLWVDKGIGTPTFERVPFDNIRAIPLPADYAGDE